MYYGANPQKVADVIRSLIRGAPPSATARPSLRPTVQEAMQMFPELASVTPSVSTNGKYTVFALTDAMDPEFCKAQDAAVSEIKQRAKDLNVNVIEVRIKK